ncbi:short chain dehydrogenase/reductase family [Paecilomyces variotii No. 5]|uniref:Short chain dehydrogenase/reductase family n=1 Tax=Byssochlamys spectabilis (strain No. 5 / NBRC 109023) TaxID=1356009 RepID=V5G6K7_BYSSN|nr:short chain dehydrogenase/reductase family [Paecilomyces variotii No. 5]
MQDLFNANGLVAVITGGGTGLGKTMAFALAANGAYKIYILGRRREPLEATARKYPTIIKPIVTDVTDKESLRSSANQIKTETGYVNVVIANAGIVAESTRARLWALNRDADVKTGPRTFNADITADEQSEALMDTSMDEFLETYKTNSVGVFHTIAAFIGLLDAGNKQGNVPQKSQVIAISSVAGESRAVSCGFAYSMSKAAVALLMKQMMAVLTVHGIRGNMIAASFFPTEILGGLPDADFTVEDSFQPEHIPLRRAGREDEMAGTILYLTSKAGGYVNGHVLALDGVQSSIF